MRLPLVILSLIFPVFVLGGGLPASIVKRLHLQPKKVYVIDFFASWCVSCKKEIPQLARLNRSLNHSRYEIIGVDADRKRSDGVKFQAALRKKGALNFRVVNDTSNAIIRTFGPPGMPALYIVKNNAIVGTIIGARSHIGSLVRRRLKGL